MVFIAILLASCSRATQPSSVERAAHYLLSAQASDGAWHSTKYQDMAQGPELTPYVLKALSYSGLKSDLTASMAYLSRQKPDSGPLLYPVYTASGILLNRVDSEEGHWRTHLLGFQATEALGWQKNDLSYGGWSYSMSPPQKIKGQPVATLSQSNLPSTLFALGGLALSPDGLEEKTQQKALVFVERCQNFPGDGGFCASPTDVAMNKAGEHRSYGSATSDGLRALLRCGLPKDHPRVKAARLWIESHLSTEVHPGDFPPARLVDRDSLYFYYLWSTAHALHALQRAGAQLTDQERTWQREVRAVLEARQGADGSWSNPVGASREDEPLITTSMAMGVLVLTGGNRPVPPKPQPTP